MNANEEKVLRFLVDEGESYEGFLFFPFASIQGPSGLDRKAVRRACRSLARKGLARFASGLCNDDGEMAGSGYGATKAGQAAISSQKRGTDR